MENNELKHYGVLGMKWGVRKNPSKAFRKATKKARKLETTYPKLEARADKLDYRGEKKMLMATSQRAYYRGKKMKIRALKTRARASKLKNKSAKWTRAMERTFYDVSISDINEKDLLKGREYSKMLGPAKVKDVVDSTPTTATETKNEKPKKS